MSATGDDISVRKSDHIRISLEEDVSSALTSGFERVHFIHEALPELDLKEVDPSTVFFGKRLRLPLLISSMTGGTERATEINRILATTAQELQIAMGVGSQRAAVEQQTLAVSFSVRKFAPTALLFANVGAVQLNYGFSIDHFRRAVEMIEADALILHLNPLQEAVQPEGDTNFSGLARRIAQLCQAMPVPVIAKEVGWGISIRTAQILAEAGISAIDVAGAGGTSWTQVEMHRISDPSRARIASAFRGWGIPTLDSLKLVQRAVPGMPIIASGGLKNGIDVAKSIALGASLAGMAAPFLKAATRSLEDTIQAVSEIEQELRICMFAAGATDIPSLQSIKLAIEPGAIAWD